MCFILRIDDGISVSPKQWYRLPDVQNSIEIQTALEGLRELISDSVTLRMRADVKVGSCLSGGLDSSSIVCLINRELRKLGKQSIQETVSSCFDIARFDERPFIEAVVRQTGVKSHYVFPDHVKLFSELECIIWHQDEPFRTTSSFAQWNVFSEARRKGLIVMLDGQGADELLAGYHDFYGAWFTQLLLSGQWRCLMNEFDSCRKHHGYSLWRMIRLMSRQLLPVGLRAVALHITGKTLPIWLNKKRLIDMGVQPKDFYKSISGSQNSITKMSRASVMSSLPTLLHYEDRDSMAHSVEVRLPFLDYRVVEYVLSLPDGLKIQNGKTIMDPKI